MASTKYLRLPIHNDFVKLPDGEVYKSKRLSVADVLSIIPEARIVCIGPGQQTFATLQTIGSGQTFYRPGYSYFVELPGFETSHSSDWYAALLAMAEPGDAPSALSYSFTDPLYIDDVVSESPTISGTSPFTYTVSAGSMPASLSLNAMTGVITGTIVQSDVDNGPDYTFTIKATNAWGHTTYEVVGLTCASVGAEAIFGNDLIANWKSTTGLYTDAGKTTAATSTGDAVYTWADSVSGLDMVQATSGSRMLLRTDGYGGRPCLVAGTSDGPRNMELPGGLSIDRQNCSVYVIARMSCQMVSGTIINIGSVLLDFLIDIDSNILRLFPEGTFTTTLRPYANPALMGVSCSASAATVVRGASSDALAALTAGSVSGGVLGARIGGAFAAAWEVYEVIVAARTSTAQDLTALRDYAAATYCPDTFTKQVVCIGDSITEGHDTTQGRNYPCVLGDSLGSTWRVWNHGIQGATCASMHTAAATHTAPYDGAYAKNVAVVLAGTNDIAVDGQTAAQTLTRLKTLCSDLQAAGYYVIVCTVLPRSDAGWNGTMETYRVALNGTSGDPADSSIMSLSATYADAKVDLAVDTLLDDPTDGTYYALSTGPHLMNAGAARVAALIKTAVEAA